MRTFIETILFCTVYTLLIACAGWGLSALWTVTGMKLGCGSELPVWGSAVLFALTSHGALYPIASGVLKR